MTKSFYIKEIRCYSKNNTISTIEFIDGLNIIHGPSNTGKSLIVKCIDYMFGAQKIEGLTNQIRVEMIIEHRDGLLKISRNIEHKKNDFEVSSTIPYIESRSYKRDGEHSISKVYLQLIGIDNFPVKVIKNQDFITQNLTLKSISHIFLLEETEIIRKESIILPKFNTANTSFLSSLLFLITGIDHSELEEKESAENKRIRKQAVKDYIHQKLSEISNYKSKIGEEILSIDEDTVKSRLDKSIENLNIKRDQLKDITNQNKEIMSSIHQLVSEREENSVSLKNFTKLIEQYKIDLNRLSMILEGDKLIHEHTENHLCPLCSSLIEDSSSEISFSEIINEIATINSKLNELNSTLSILTEKDKEIENKIEQHNQTLRLNLNHINTVLQPSIELLKQSIKEYNMYFNVQSEMRVLNTIRTEWNNDIDEIESQDDNTKLFKPKDHFPTRFFSDMRNILYQILELCSFPNLENVNLDKSTFDIIVNGKSKEREGKGYRAYLNTVLALAIREYLYKFGAYYIPIFITDTPLLGLDESEETGIDSMRTSLHNYLYESSKYGQVIIADNNKDLPDIDYGGKNINMINFTKSNNGRYGFLIDIIE